MKSEKNNIVIFDVDGTLLDTTEGIIASVKYTIGNFNFPQLHTDELLSFIGPPIQESFRQHYGINDKEKLQEIATVFRNRYKDYDLLKAKPYNGIYDLCDYLIDSGYKIAIATYKRQDYATDILLHFGFDKYSNTMYGADHENKLKKADIIRMCISNLTIDGDEEVVMIGDSANDAEGAQKLGIGFIGVTYGFGFKTSEEVMKYNTAIGYAAYPLDIKRLL